jgi:hypothetical protein
MALFDPVTLHWDGRVYSIPPNRVLGAIARVEDTVTLYELYGYSKRGTAPLAKLATAFGGLLRYAGANVEDDAVYVGMFSSADNQNAVTTALNVLLSLMVPKSALGGGTSEGNGLAASAAANKSRRSTKRPSA